MRYVKPRLYTAGYEGRSIDGFVQALVDQSVQQVIDVRLRPNSRRPGFSKIRLAETLATAGIKYRHDQDLGTPAEIMKLLRETGVYDWDGYIAHLDCQPEAVDRAIEIASTEATCLICYESDPLDCHRSIIADRLTSRLDLNRTDI